MRSIRRAAVAGMIGPLLLGGVIMGLTITQYEFMIGLRWHPLRAPTLDWPSGLALGPYGHVMVATFIVSGMLLIVFAIGLDQALGGRSHVGTWLLMLAGLAVMLLALKVDPSFRDTPATWHGHLHDLAYVLLGLTLFPALLLLTPRFRNDRRWHGHAAYTCATLALVAPAFVLKGVMFYIFLAAMLAWIEVTAIRVWRSSATS